MRDVYARPPGLGSPTSAGPVTRALCASLVTTSLVLSLVARRGGLSAGQLMFDRQAVLGGQVWRLFTYAFVETSSPLALVFGALVLWLFGSQFEARWGSRDFLRFFLLTTVGGALLALPLGAVGDFVLPFRDIGLAQGPDAAIDAMLVACALGAPDSQLLFGFVLPIRARNFVWVVLGMQAIGGIMNGAASMGITLGGMLMGYLLVTGLWRPKLAWGRLRLWHMARRRRNRLYVVPPRDRRDLH